MPTSPFWNRALCFGAFVVEDEWVARDYLVQLAERSGLARVVGAVEAFEDAARFLAASAASDAVDVVFVDINLVGSDQNGLALVELFSGERRAPQPSCWPRP